MSHPADDDFSDMIQISPPTSSTSLMADNHIDEKPHIKLESSSSASPSARSTSIESQSSQSSFESPPSSQKVDDKSITHANITATPKRELPTTSHVAYKTPNPITPAKKEVKPPAEVFKDVHNTMEDTMKRVRQQSDKLQSVAQPYADRTRNFAESNPVLFTFIVLWVGFSSIPILIFLGFILAATVFIVSIALFVSALVIIGAALMGGAAIIGTILFGAAILAPVLFITTLLSFGTLITLLGLFLIHRLYLHISISSSEEGLTSSSIGLGIKAWFEETYQRVLLSLPRFGSNNTGNTAKAPLLDGNGKENGHLTNGNTIKEVNGTNTQSPNIPQHPSETENGTHPNKDKDIAIQKSILQRNNYNHHYNTTQYPSTSISDFKCNSPLNEFHHHHHQQQQIGTALSEKIGKGDIKDTPRLDI